MIGHRLAKHDGKHEPAGEAAFDARELLAALSRPTLAKRGSRNQSVANCLSAQDGWRDEAERLGGAFAPLGPQTGLTDGKE